MDPTLLSNLIAAVLFAVLGIVTLIATFIAIDWFTPFSLWKEIIDEHNTALAVLMGFTGLGISLIIAAAIH
ncbi:MAG: DUF350 domain-containing protein [Vicinamibacteria bacterium]|nr:DUF350 domain-containing protein [Vicinamibacteria bacterium]